MSRRLIPILSLCAAVMLLIMLNFTTPTDVGPLGVLAFMGAAYMLLFGLAYLLVVILTKITGRKTSKKSYLYSAVIAFGPIMLLLAQSVGSMSMWTVGLMIVFVLLGCFLVNKRA